MMFKLLVVCILATRLPAIHGAWNGSQKTLVPAYFYPGTLWDQMISKGAGIIVANPSSGPGLAVDSNYVTYINKARTAGINVVGYVYTSYGSRPASAVKADIDAYLNFYNNVNGFFLDEVQTTTNANLAYYTDLANYIRRKKSTNLVVLNPGVIPTIKTFMDIANVVVIKEDAYSTSATFTIPSWLQAYNPFKICLIYHTASGAAAMRTAVTKGKKLNAGYMYVTDDVMNNPYDKLPTYYSQEITALAAKISG